MGECVDLGDGDAQLLLLGGSEQFVLPHPLTRWVVKLSCCRAAARDTPRRIWMRRTSHSVLLGGFASRGLSLHAPKEHSLAL